MTMVNAVKRFLMRILGSIESSCLFQVILGEIKGSSDAREGGTCNGLPLDRGKESGGRLSRRF